MLTRLFHRLAQLGLGQELAFALLLLQTLLKVMNNRDLTNALPLVYQQLPSTWRTPNGPVSETEFVELAQAGQVLLSKIQAVFRT